jgi:hypothetical protein
LGFYERRRPIVGKETHYHYSLIVAKRAAENIFTVELFGDCRLFFWQKAAGTPQT